MKTALIILLSAVSITTATAQHSRTTRHGRLVPNETADTEETVPSQTMMAVDTDSLTITRYDKPLRSLRETFFVTNHYSDTIAALRFKIKYEMDNNGDMLHRREATITCEIPPGETRQLYVAAWDRQYTYYYSDTRIRPKSAKAIAYTVEMTPTGIVLRGHSPAQ